MVEDEAVCHLAKPHARHVSMLEDLVPWLYLLRALGIVGAVLSVLGSLAVCE